MKKDKGFYDHIVGFIVFGAFGLAAFGVNHRLEQIETRLENLQAQISDSVRNERDTYGRITALENSKK